MKVFLIILAVLAVIIAIILSLSAEFEVVFDNGWSTKIRVLWIEKDIELSKLLSFLLFPEKSAEEAAEKAADKASEKDGKKDEAPEPPKTEEKKAEPSKEKKEQIEIPPPDEEHHLTDEEIEQIVKQLAAEEETEETQPEQAEEKGKKPNFIKKLWDDEGLVGILSLVTNLLETADTAARTLIKGLHIYSLYVKMIIGGGDAADIAEKYASLAGHYYPVKGIILNQMRVDQYDDLIEPDFIAPRSEYEFQIIASLNIALLLKVALRAGKVFLVNLIKNKKSK